MEKSTGGEAEIFGLRPVLWFSDFALSDPVNRNCLSAGNRPHRCPGTANSVLTLSTPRPLT